MAWARHAAQAAVKNVIGPVKAYASKKSRENTPLPASLLRDEVDWLTAACEALYICNAAQT
jgi:hypothetical protein